MNVTSEVKPFTIRETELLNFLLEYASTHHYSIAVWQLPQQSSKLILLAKKTMLIERNEPLEDMEGGFVFAPFDRVKAAMYLPAELQFRIVDDVMAAPASKTEMYSLSWLRDNFKTPTPKKITTHQGPTGIGQIQDHDYLGLVRKSIAEIEKGTFEKVVPSRRKSVTLPQNFDIVVAFVKLCKASPHAFVSLISSPEAGTWIGASPEELVRVADKTIFRTVALAGTQPYHEGINLKKVAWTQKEIEEQALVERYIISCFKKIRLREYDEFGPKTVIAGNLMHLKSEFTVNMKETNFPQLASTMLNLLHPTSAVCGVPLDPALEFLRINEGYSRSFYSGYLGPVNVDNQIDIFVNLRCMQLFNEKAMLYAGAGVTIDSIPEQEWEETEMKMNTLLRVIQS